MYTARLSLHVPRPADLPELHAIYADPRVWEHFPSLRHVREQQSREMLQAWIAAWEHDGLGPWIVRPREGGAMLGNGGCAVRAGVFWNLGYRFAPAAHGHGYATEVARAAVVAAREVNPELPIVAYLLENNPASRRVAEKVGLTLRHSGPDAGNPRPDAVRLVFADRELSEGQRAAVLR